MGFHHLAFATNDLEATHAFYTDVMGFRLVKAVAGDTGSGGGWAKHLFYDTGDGTLLAFWELHDDKIAPGWNPAISLGLGLPEWVNHVAFHADDLDDLHGVRDRWMAHGIDVAEIDHGWCTSIYAMDPNGILVEFCTTTQPMTTADADAAERIRLDPAPAIEPPPDAVFHTAAAPTPAVT